MIASEQETQRVLDLRYAHRDWSFTVDPRNLVFIDETGMHLGFTRLYGRAPKGERLYGPESPGNRGQNISLIGGMTIDGLIATMSVVGSVNTHRVLVLRPRDPDSPTLGRGDHLDGQPTRSPRSRGTRSN